MTLRDDRSQAILAVVATCVVGALLAGAAPAAGQTSEHRWHRSDLAPVTQPLARAGRFIFLEGSGGGLHLVALDAKTGRTAWSRLASISGVTPGVAPSVDVAGSRVIALLASPEVKDEAVVAAVDAGTGRIAWASPRGRFSSTPAPCPGEPRVVCVTGTLANGQASGGLRFDLASGKTLAPVALDRQGARDIGGGLLDPGLRKPDYLIAVHGSAIAWRVPLARIFGAGSSTDNGWNFSRFDTLGLLVGSVGYTPLKLTRTSETVDLSRQMTAGFRIADGSVIWRNRGALFMCEELPCPGYKPGGFADQAGASRARSVIGLRLRMRGTLTSKSVGSFSTSPNTIVTLEGFALATGRTLWRFNAGRAVALIAPTTPLPQTTVDRIILRARAGDYVELDLRTGARRHVASTTRAWCRGFVTYRETVPYQTAGRTITKYIGQGSLFPCLATGARLQTPTRVPAIVAAIGASAEGVVAWSDKTGVTAAPTA